MHDLHMIENYLQSEIIEEDQADSCNAEAEKIIAQILQKDINGHDEERKAYILSIKAFLAHNEVQKRKLLSFCLDFVDPTVQPKKIIQNGEEIQLNTYLQEDDLYKLYQFVKRHESDNTFGSTVYKVMDKHQLTAPQVYKAALLRRQDFSRATDPKAKNVSKLIAWQIIIGLQCNMDEADEELFSAGYIRRKSKFDLTMEYFIKHQNYDIMAINEVLDELKLKVFSCYKSVRDNDNL